MLIFSGVLVHTYRDILSSYHSFVNSEIRINTRGQNHSFTIDGSSGADDSDSIADSRGIIGQDFDATGPIIIFNIELTVEHRGDGLAGNLNGRLV